MKSLVRLLKFRDCVTQLSWSIFFLNTGNTMIQSSRTCNEANITSDTFKKTTGPPNTISENNKAPLLFSTRLALSIISCLGFIILYMLRVNLSVTIVCMVNHTAVLEHKIAQGGNGSQAVSVPLRPRTCGGEVSNTTNLTSGDEGTKDGELLWPKELQGLLLGSFFWGYLTTQIIGGFLADRFGGKRIYGWFMFLCAVATLFTPIAARVDYRALMALRFIAGVCQGVAVPAMVVLWTRWAPPLEQQKLCGLCYAGTQIGNVLTFPIAALLCEYGFDGGWPSVFYVLGICGILWFVAWMYIVYDSPEIHPRISEAEKVYITESLHGSISMSLEKKKSTPWIPLLTSTRVWAIIVSQTCANWGTYTFLTNIPSYMREVLYFDLKKNSLVSALPYIVFFLVINIAGVIFDAVMVRQLLSRTMARKIGNTIGLLVPAIFVLGVGFMDCTQPIQAVILLVIGVSMSGFQYGAGFLTNPVDIAPSYAGVIFGLANTLGTVPGFVAPTVIGIITTDQTKSQWQVVFYITAAIYTFGAIYYFIFASGDIQKWAVDETEQDIVPEKPFASSSLTNGKTDEEKSESRL